METIPSVLDKKLLRTTDSATRQMRQNRSGCELS